MKIASGVNCKHGIKRILNKATHNKKMYYPNHYDYTINLFKHGKETAEISTNKQDGILRNVSLVAVNPNSAFKYIKAAIGNKTGNIAISEKPWWMSLKKAAKKVESTIQNASTHPQDIKVDEQYSKSRHTIEVLEFFKKL